MKSRMSFKGNEPHDATLNSKYLNLLMRNDELAFELNRLKHEYRNLQKHFNALMLKAIILKVETRDFGTQTLGDETYKNFRLIVNEENLADYAYHTPQKGDKLSIAQSSHPKVSPSQIRVTKELSGRIEMEKNEEKKGNLLQERINQAERPSRARKQVIYTEPSLKVKVRKGFKFFKTNE